MRTSLILLLLLFIVKKGLVRARLKIEANAVKEARLRHLRHVFSALLLLHAGPVKAAAAALVQNFAINLMMVNIVS